MDVVIDYCIVVYSIWLSNSLLFRLVLNCVLMMILIFVVNSWLLHHTDYLDFSAIIPEQKWISKGDTYAGKKFKHLCSIDLLSILFQWQIYSGFPMITYVRTVHGWLSYSLSILLCFVMQPMIQSMLSQTWWGWVGGGVCVCAGVRAGWVGGGGGGGWGVGGEGALAPPQGVV